MAAEYPQQQIRKNDVKNESKKHYVDIPHPVGCDIAVGRAIVPGQGRVVVTPNAGCGELVENVLSLI